MSHQDEIDRLQQRLIGEGIIRSGIEAIAKRLYKPKGWTKADISTPYPDGMPPKPFLYSMEESTYSAVKRQQIGSYKLIKQTPTLLFYYSKINNTMVVAIRGTFDKSDIYADIKLAMGNLAGSTRYRADEKILRSVLADPDYKNTPFYGVGHSLGGAILDLFLAKGLLKAGVSYNPAVEKSQLNSNKNYRIYMANDPLYNTMGKYSKIGEVRKQKDVSESDVVGAVQSVKSHLLTNFVGGIKLM
jgi:hypothetical protein